MAAGVPGGATPGGGLGTAIAELNRHMQELIRVRKQTAAAQAARSDHAQGRMRMAHAAFAVERAGQQIGGDFAGAGAAVGAGIQAARSFGVAGGIAAFGIEAMGFAAARGQQMNKLQADLDVAGAAPMSPMARMAENEMATAAQLDMGAGRTLTNFLGGVSTFAGKTGTWGRAAATVIPGVGVAASAGDLFGTDSAENEARRRIAENQSDPAKLGQEFMHRELSGLAAQGVRVSELSEATLKRLQELNDREAREFLWVDQQYGTFGSNRGAGR